MKPKAEIVEYEFECGCRSKEVWPIYLGKKSVGTRRILCPKHKEKIKCVHLICPDCNEIFTSSTIRQIRCLKCKVVHGNAEQRKRDYYKKHPAGKNELELTQKQLIEPSGTVCGALCAHRDRCLSDHLFRGKEFVCKKCDRYERFDITNYTIADGEQVLSWTFR